VALLTVETETNGDLWSTNEGDPRCAGTRDFYPALAALISPVQHIFFLTVHYFNFSQQPGQAVEQGRLSLNVCLRHHHRLCLGGFCGGVKILSPTMQVLYSRCASCGGQEKHTPSSRKIMLGVGKCT
jgi:hypothetical protein